MNKQSLIVLFLLVLLPMTAAAQQSGPFTILFTNDDGYEAPGLKALLKAFEGYADIFVAAPALNQSGKGHSITTSDPVFVFERRQPGGNVWLAIDAPPATSLRLGLEALSPRRPDLVISGINRGENLGIVVYYSGTLGAAREAAISGIPAIAVSMDGDDPADYERTAVTLRQLVEKMRAAGSLAPGFFLNVNAPRGEAKGVRVTRLSLKENRQLFERRTSPRGRLYYWTDYRPLADDEEGTDVWAFLRGFVTITPMVLDVTNAAALDAFQKFEQTRAPSAAAAASNVRE